METFNLMAVRCTCGKNVGSYQYQYERLLREGYNIEQALDRLGMTRQCCRKEFMCPMIVPLGIERSYGEREEVILSEEQGIVHRLSKSGEPTIEKLQQKPQRQIVPPSERIAALHLKEPKNLVMSNIPSSIRGKTEPSFIQPKILSFGVPPNVSELVKCNIPPEPSISTLPTPSLPASFITTPQTTGRTIRKVIPPSKQTQRRIVINKIPRKEGEN